MIDFQNLPRVELIPNAAEDFKRERKIEIDKKTFQQCDDGQWWLEVGKKEEDQREKMKTKRISDGHRRNGPMSEK